MGRYHTFAIILTAWLPALLVGCGRSQGTREEEYASEAISEPLLKVDDDAKTVIDKAVKIYGGEKVFSRWNCGYVKYKTKGGIIPPQLGEVTVEDTFQLPGHFKRVTLVPASGRELQTVFVVNHGKAWTKHGDAPAEPGDNDFTEKTEHPFAGFCNLVPLTEKGIRLTKLGEKIIDGRKAMAIRVQSDKLGDVDFYFGSQTGLLLKSSKSLPAEGEKRSVVESYLDDYKDVQGGKVPMRIKGMQDGRVILDVTLIDVKFAEKLEDSTFAKP